MKLRRNALLVVLALGFPACSGGSDGDPTAPELANVAGSWEYVASDLTGEIGTLSLRCALVGEMDLDQLGATFSGTLDGVAFTCEVPGTPIRETVLLNKSLLIIDGQLIGTDVGFQYDAPFLHPEFLKLIEDTLGAPVFFAVGAFHHIGTISSSGMSGTVFVTLDIMRTGARDLTTILEGTYLAVR